MERRELSNADVTEMSPQCEMAMAGCLMEHLPLSEKS
jgi:hypothetical protein